MPIDDSSTDAAFVAEVEHELGRPLSADEARLASQLKNDKSSAVVAREIAGAPIADPKKIRPEHKDTADE